MKSLLNVLFIVELWSEEQFNRARRRTIHPLFKLQMDDSIKTHSSDSFLLSFYQDLYLKMKKRLKIDISVIDFNLTRLRHCIEQVVIQRDQQQTMLNIDELALALEFYLQFDGNIHFLFRHRQKICL